MFSLTWNHLKAQHSGSRNEVHLQGHSCEEIHLELNGFKLLMKWKVPSGTHCRYMTVACSRHLILDSHSTGAFQAMWWQHQDWLSRMVQFIRKPVIKSTLHFPWTGSQNYKARLGPKLPGCRCSIAERILNGKHVLWSHYHKRLVPGQALALHGPLPPCQHCLWF